MIGRKSKVATLFLVGFLILMLCDKREAAWPLPLPEICEMDRPDLSVEQLLEDYDTMWQIIEQNFPLMGVVQRAYPDFDAERVRRAYRNSIASMAGRGLAPDIKNATFEKAVRGALEAFGGQGHLWYVNEENYSHFLQIYHQVADQPTCAYDYGQLRRAESVAWYGYRTGDYEAAASSPGKQSSKLSTEQTGDTAVIRVPGFDLNAITADRPIWQQFYQQAQSCHDLVIDLRGNPGGSDQYWKELIAGPNIKETTAVEQVRLVRGVEATEYQRLSGGTYHPIEEYDLRPQDNAEDVASMEGYFVEDQVVEPTADSPAFAGHIWVLVDRRVYSAAEGFAYWCKNTGFATLVGQRTGGDGVGIDPQVFSLPHTGFCFRFSSALGLNAEGGSNEEYGTEPDVLLEEGENAYMACLKLIGEEKRK